MRLQAAESTEEGVTLDHELAQQILEAADSLSGKGIELAAIDPLKVLSWPGVVSTPGVDLEQLRRDALEILNATLDDFVAAREREGEKTRDMLVERVDAIEKIVESVKAIRPAVTNRLKEKLLARLSELNMPVDQGRLEQELVFAAQKLDVDEELDRLDAHIAEIRAIFARKEPVGRRLDFLIQEFNREANTLGSKSADSDTTGFTVELKVMIEQMREQVQNIE
ncbi:MAG: YicC family protein [Gammaproteobacteria bacterium]|nr:YicC family protein [Gammaproteobacteria bacterium]